MESILRQVCIKLVLTPAGHSCAATQLKIVYPDAFGGWVRQAVWSNRRAHGIVLRVLVCFSKLHLHFPMGIGNGALGDTPLADGGPCQPHRHTGVCTMGFAGVPQHASLGRVVCGGNMVC